MKISLNKLFLLIVSFLVTSLFSATIDEARRNYNLGYFLISEYIYTDLLDAGESEEEALVGLSLSLIQQAKYKEIIELAHSYTSSSPVYNRNIAYSYFMNNKFQASYYYYDKAVKEDETSLLDITGRGWSAYYLGKFSLAYEDFLLINKSENKHTSFDELKYLTENWKNHYCELFAVFSENSTNYNLNYNYYLPNFSLGATYNFNKGEDSDRDMITLHSNYRIDKLSFDLSAMGAKGDYSKFYDGYGLAFQSSYLLMKEKYQTTFSLLGGYTYFESLSSQQVRLDIRVNRHKFGLSSGVSYLYLDYITPDFDEHEFLYHVSFAYKLAPPLFINYKLTLGKRNFAYNGLLIPYDNMDIDNLMQSAMLSYNLKSYTLYLKFINKDMTENSIGTGVSYVF